MTETPYFDQSGEISDAPPQFVHVRDLDPLIVIPGLEFRPVTTDSVMTNFVTFEPNAVAPDHHHDEQQIAIVLSDGPNPKLLDIGTAAFHEVWITDATPAPIAAGEKEPTDRPVRTPPPAGGVIVRFTEMAPGAEAPMHRTETVDVGVVLEGETWLLLDDGSETRVGPGDADELRAATGPLQFFDQVLD